METNKRTFYYVVPKVSFVHNERWSINFKSGAILVKYIYAIPAAPTLEKVCAGLKVFQ